MTIASLPTWELDQLASLYQQGGLSGVDPRILAAIDQAESSGQGGGVNSSGYGGWFGLGENTAYPGGWSTSPALLTSTSPQAFDTQAQTAAAEFNSLLSSYSGDPYAAEQAYQGGGTEGTNVFSQNGIPQLDPAAGPITPSSASATTTSGLNLNPGDAFGIPSAVGGSVWSSAEPFLAQALLVVLGLGVIGMGIWSLSKRSGAKSPSPGDLAPLLAA